MRASETLFARMWLVALVLLVVSAAPPPAAGKVKICVSFHGAKLKNRAGYQRLLKSELRHHPTSRLAVLQRLRSAASGEDGCRRGCE